MIVAVAVLPAASDTVIVTVAVFASALSGVPLITPPASMPSPDGRSAAPYSAMSTPPLGLMDVIASPTFRDTGAL